MINFLYTSLIYYQFIYLIYFNYKTNKIKTILTIFFISWYILYKRLFEKIFI